MLRQYLREPSRIGAAIGTVVNSQYSIWAVLCLALILRVIGLRNIYYGFTGELYRDLLVVHHFIAYGDWPLLGPMGSVGGYYFGPAYYYLLAPFVWLANLNPIGAIVASGFFSVFTVYIVYGLVNLWTGQRSIALLAAFLLSISTRDIQNSYYVSNPNFLPFFTVLLLYALTHIALQPKTIRWWFIAGIAFGIATQLHVVALVVLSLIGITALIVYKLYRHVWYVMCGLFAFFLTYTPYLYYECTHGFANIHRLMQVGGSSYGFVPKAQPLMVLLEFWISTLFLKNDLFTFFNVHSGFYIFSIVCAATIGLAAYVYTRKVKGVELLNKRGLFFVVAWSLAGLMVFWWYQSSVQFFYLLILWPLPVIVLTCMYAHIWTVHRTWLGVLLIAYILVQAVQLRYLYSSLHEPAYSHGHLLQVFKDMDARARGQSYIIISPNADINMLRYYTELAQGRPYRGVFGAHSIYNVHLKTEVARLPFNSAQYVLEDSYSIDFVYVERYIRKNN